MTNEKSYEMGQVAPGLDSATARVYRDDKSGKIIVSVDNGCYYETAGFEPRVLLAIVEKFKADEAFEKELTR